jgi:hypothetical protein
MKSKKTFLLSPVIPDNKFQTWKPMSMQELDDQSTGYRPCTPGSFKVIHHCDCTAAALTFRIQKY